MGDCGQGKGMCGRNRDGSRCGETPNVVGRMGRGAHPVFYPPSCFILLFASPRLRWEPENPSMLTVYYRKTPAAVKCSALRLGVEGAQ